MLKSKIFKNLINNESVKEISKMLTTFMLMYD